MLKHRKSSSAPDQDPKLEQERKDELKNWEVWSERGQNDRGDGPQVSGATLKRLNPDFSGHFLLLPSVGGTLPSLLGADSKSKQEKHHLL